MAPTTISLTLMVETMVEITNTSISITTMVSRSTRRSTMLIGRGSKFLVMIGWQDS